MSTAELRTHFHQLIDRINNDAVLNAFYKLMSKFQDSKDGRLWSRLSKDEQEELMVAEMESHDTGNLLSEEAMKKKHSKRL